MRTPRTLDGESFPDYLPEVPESGKENEWLYLGMVGNTRGWETINGIVALPNDRKWEWTNYIDQPENARKFHYCIRIPKFVPLPIISDKTPI